MKVLFIAHYRDGNSGWANAAKEFILAMDSAGIDVVPRPIKLNNDLPNIHDRIRQLENKSTEGCTVCIQNVLPHHMVYNSGMKNIGLVFLESVNTTMTSWQSNMELMDEIWVTNNDYKPKHKSIKVIPVPTDINKFNSISIKPELGPDFKFYFIGNYNRRKNISGILRAFHTEFSYNEPVSLVLKLDKYGHSPEELAKKVYNHSEIIKKSLKIYNNTELYKREIVITDELTEEQVLGLHKECDCFVNAAFGEGWGMSVVDALLCGNKVVSQNIGGPAMYWNDNCYYVEGMLDNVVGMQDDSFPDQGKGFDQWHTPSVNSLGYAMRAAYNDRNNNKIVDMSKLSYKNVGQIIKEVLNA